MGFGPVNLCHQSNAAASLVLPLMTLGDRSWDQYQEEEYWSQAATLLVRPYVCAWYFRSIVPLPFIDTFFPLSDIIVVVITSILRPGKHHCTTHGPRANKLCVRYFSICYKTSNEWPSTVQACMHAPRSKVIMMIVQPATHAPPLLSVKGKKKPWMTRSFISHYVYLLFTGQT